MGRRKRDTRRRTNQPLRDSLGRFTTPWKLKVEEFKEGVAIGIAVVVVLALIATLA